MNTRRAIQLLQAVALAAMAAALFQRPLGLMLGGMFAAQAALFGLQGCDRLTFFNVVGWIFAVGASLTIQLHAGGYV